MDKSEQPCPNPCSNCSSCQLVEGRTLRKLRLMTRQVDNQRVWDTTMAPARAGCHDARTDWPIGGTASTLSTYYVPENVLKGFTIVSNLILTTNLLGLSSFYRWGNCSSEKLANQFISGRSLTWPRAMWLQSLGSSSLRLPEEASGTWAEAGRRRYGTG